jgi:hypothetical protein
VPVTVVPATALVGKATLVLTLLRFGVMLAVLLLSARVVSGTVLPLATAVTLAVLVPTKTLTGTVTLPLAGMLTTVVLTTPLMVMVEVKLVATGVVLV